MLNYSENEILNYISSKSFSLTKFVNGLIPIFLFNVHSLQKYLSTCLYLSMPLYVVVFVVDGKVSESDLKSLSIAFTTHIISVKQIIEVHSA